MIVLKLDVRSYIYLKTIALQQGILVVLRVERRSCWQLLTYTAGPVNKQTPKQELEKLPANERADKEPRQASLAERSKALAQGASPQGRGLEPHSCHISCCRCPAKSRYYT